jgi:hypothetical protein
MGKQRVAFLLNRSLNKMKLALVFLHGERALNFCVHLNDGYVVLPFVKLLNL